MNEEIITLEEITINNSLYDTIDVWVTYYIEPEEKGLYEAHGAQITPNYNAQCVLDKVMFEHNDILPTLDREFINYIENEIYKREEL
jgi:hypothetical protein